MGFGMPVTILVARHTYNILGNIKLSINLLVTVLYRLLVKNEEINATIQLPGPRAKPNRSEYIDLVLGYPLYYLPPPPPHSAQN